MVNLIRIITVGAILRHLTTQSHFMQMIGNSRPINADGEFVFQECGENRERPQLRVIAMIGRCGVKDGPLQPMFDFPCNDRRSTRRFTRIQRLISTITIPIKPFADRTPADMKDLCNELRTFLLIDHRVNTDPANVVHDFIWYLACIQHLISIHDDLQNQSRAFLAPYYSTICQ